MLGVLIIFFLIYGLGCVLSFWLVYLNARYKVTKYKHHSTIGESLQLSLFSWIAFLVIGFDMINATLTKTEFFSRPIKDLFKRE